MGIGSDQGPAYQGQAHRSQSAIRIGIEGRRRSRRKPQRLAVSGETAGKDLRGNTLASRLAENRRCCGLSAEQRAVDSFTCQGIDESAGVSHEQDTIPQIRL